MIVYHRPTVPHGCCQSLHFLPPAYLYRPLGGPASAVGSVCLCVRTISFEQNGLSLRHLTQRFTLIAFQVEFTEQGRTRVKVHFRLRVKEKLGKPDPVAVEEK